MLYSLVVRGGNSLARLSNWSRLTFTASVSVSAATAVYALPTDFYDLMPNTVWVGTEEAWGPTNATDWKYYEQYGVGGSTDKRWRIKRAVTSASVPALIIQPAPTTDETWVFEYRSRQWIADGTSGVPKDDWTADTDVTILDDQLLYADLRWRWLKAKGLPYAEDYNEFIELKNAEIARDAGTGQRLSMNGGRAFIVGGVE